MKPVVIRGDYYLCPYCKNYLIIDKDSYEDFGKIIWKCRKCKKKSVQKV